MDATPAHWFLACLLHLVVCACCARVVRGVTGVRGVMQLPVLRWTRAVGANARVGALYNISPNSKEAGPTA